MGLPRLTEVQLRSFEWFRTEGLRELFEEISPIVSFNKNLELHLGDFHFGEPKYPEDECRERDITFSAPLWVKVKLINNDTGEISEQEVFMGDFPLMTDSATFIINGSERVVVSQLIRSPGVYFTVEEDRSTGRDMAGAKMIPSRGAWLEFETSRRDIISVKVDRKRKLPVTILLRAIGFGTDEEIRSLFTDVDTDVDHPFIESTLERDTTANPTDNTEKGVDDALLEFYKKLRPGDPPTLDNAKSFMQNLFFAARRYDLGKVGRYKLNRRLRLDTSLNNRILTNEDLIAVIKRIININNGSERPDDIDHLGNRRIKTVGELVQNQLRIGLLRMERVVRERMSIRDPEQVTPLSLINIRPVVAATREFFGGSQLSQFMDQTNPLAELTHKRRLSALGPGGLRRERAGFDVRDVHYSHYGRICPIETPEGPNIGLIGSLASFARVNEYGFIETPYRRVYTSVPADETAGMVGRILWDDIIDPATGEMVAERETVIDAALAERLVAVAALAGQEQIVVKPFASEEVVYLNADEEENASIAQASSGLNRLGEFQNPRPSARHAEDFRFELPENIRYMDVSPKQIVGVSASLIPFLEHDDANRALMGSNMQRQAVPLVRPDAPIVGTGVEYQAAVDSGQVVVARNAGEVVSVVGNEIVVMEADGTRRSYHLRKYHRSNQSTSIDQRPLVFKGDIVAKGTVLADSSSTDRGELALGQNVLVAYLSWEGGNFEDAILVSERLVQDDKYTSLHVEKHEIEARETKLGPEEITRDIPNVGEDALKDLDEEGIIRIGAEVTPGDILVGKITPKGETELTPEEKLLRAIFGEKAREVKDSSLRLPHGERGKVVDVKVFARDEHRDLPAGVEKIVRVGVAQRRRLTEGDKMAGRHGNKGVISKVVPVEDMPFLEDGTAVDIILNPLGVPGRMNIGQILEAHLGWAALRMGFMAETPVFDGAKEDEIEAELARTWLTDRAWDVARRKAWSVTAEAGIPSHELEDDIDALRIYLADWLEPLGYDAESIFSSVPYARRACVRGWLDESGYDAELLIPAHYDNSRTNEESNAAVIEATLREWMSYYGGEHKDLSGEELIAAAQELSDELVMPLPTTGKQRLYDGKTGVPYDLPVTVGVVQMLKLHHLVEDKVHARSTGPYSLVTQQPLGGKAQFGGQRFGEMEVWALEAYGAAYTLQEMLTIKSDDVSGRVKTYEAIVKGEDIQSPGVPESFRVLVKELQSLALAVEVINDKNEVIQFGKDDAEERLPKLGFSLNIPSPMARSQE
ncbi:MAG: DNA-directed RNA polymerase subunit beta [Caldilineaceae bacterium]|nr:DNA-directed RNA polymerase subunit beta [Caldilineaceae bacterium]MBP8109589.1 DNA-directed RNA polymerase subunit beta [Caldilineaceae bacterium]MBP8122069.1 DNA-directed RNA polymerase subunit beta [Caldilineaceae bacterium]MBP9074635.1 DNA-directed RNA polymerase subunit beta [Caldilineaceae bacterium]